MAKELFLVVGQDPHSDLIGFNTIETYDYGSCVPNAFNGELVSKFTTDTGTDAVAIKCDGLLGTKYNFTTETGVVLPMTGSAGSLTGSLTAFKTAMAGHMNGVFNMLLSVLAVFTSAGTVDANTIAIVLDETADITDAANWSVDINTGTDNVVTGVLLGTDTAVLTVTDAITVGQTITVSHTAATGDEVDTITAQTVVNNEA